MRRKYLLILLAILLLAGGIAGSMRVLSPQENTRVDILQDGVALYQLDISQEGNRTISIEYQRRTNLIEICDGRIRVAEADCPDQLCVQMGWLQNSGLPVVCLPNRLVIQYAQSPDGPDAIS